MWTIKNEEIEDGNGRIRIRDGAVLMQEQQGDGDQLPICLRHIAPQKGIIIQGPGIISHYESI